jgi:hypothetical protein
MIFCFFTILLLYNQNIFYYKIGTLLCFSGVVRVDGRPERSSSSTEVRPSLKRLYHKKGLFWLMLLSLALSAKAYCSIWWVSAAVCLKTEKNLVQILCTVIPVVRKSPDH